MVNGLVLHVLLSPSPTSVKLTVSFICFCYSISSNVISRNILTIICIDSVTQIKVVFRDCNDTLFLSCEIAGVNFLITFEDCFNYCF